MDRLRTRACWLSAGAWARSLRPMRSRVRFRAGNCASDFGGGNRFRLKTEPSIQ
jgi:hypothetical protein